MKGPDSGAPEQNVQELAAATMPPRSDRDDRDDRPEQDRRAAHIEAIRKRLDAVYREGFGDGAAWHAGRAPARMVLTTAEFEQVRAKFNDAESTQ